MSDIFIGVTLENLKNNLFKDIKYMLSPYESTDVHISQQL